MRSLAQGYIDFEPGEPYDSKRITRALRGTPRCRPAIFSVLIFGLRRRGDPNYDVRSRYPQ